MECNQLKNKENVYSTSYHYRALVSLIHSFNKHLSDTLVAQMVKNPPTMQATWVRSLGWEDLLEKEMATHSSILAWRIPWTEEPDGLQFTGWERVGHD